MFLLNVPTSRKPPLVLGLIPATVAQPFLAVLPSSQRNSAPSAPLRYLFILLIP
jgi:hypothetical protein